MEPSESPKIRYIEQCSNDLHRLKRIQQGLSNCPKGSLRDSIELVLHSALNEEIDTFDYKSECTKLKESKLKLQARIQSLELDVNSLRDENEQLLETLKPDTVVEYVTCKRFKWFMFGSFSILLLEIFWLWSQSKT